MKSAENQTRTSICHGETDEKGGGDNTHDPTEHSPRFRRFQKGRERDGESEERSPDPPSMTNVYSLRR